MEGWQVRLEYFEKALKRLEEAVQRPPTSDLEKEGLCHRFEFTFELAWKTLKDFLAYQGLGFPLGSPREVLRTALQAGLLEGGEAWLNLLALRNRLSHLYDKKLLDEAFYQISTVAYPLLRNLYEKLQERRADL